jgi:hypothetical protein
MPKDPLEYEIRIPGGDGSPVVKKVRECSTAEIRRSLRKRSQAASTNKAGNSTEIGAGRSAQAEEVSERSLVRELGQGGLGIAMLLYGVLVPSSSLTGFCIAMGAVLVLKAAQPLIRLGRSWLQSPISGENFFEIVAKLSQKAAELGRAAAHAVNSALSRHQAGEIRKKLAGFARRSVGTVGSAVSPHRADELRKKAASFATTVVRTVRSAASRPGADRLGKKLPRFARKVVAAVRTAISRPRAAELWKAAPVVKPTNLRRRFSLAGLVAIGLTLLALGIYSSRSQRLESRPSQHPNEESPEPTVAQKPSDAESRGASGMPPKSEFGTLVLKVAPWALLSIDGEPRGEVNGMRRIRLSAGKHRIRLWHPKASRDLWVTIRPGEQLVRQEQLLLPAQTSMVPNTPR